MNTYLILQVVVLLKWQYKFSSLWQQVQGSIYLFMQSHKCSLPLKDSHMFAQYLGQFIHLERLWHEIVHSGFKTDFSAIGKNTGSKGYDLGLKRWRKTLANQSGGLQAVHLRHVQVHQNYIIRLTFQGQ